MCLIHDESLHYIFQNIMEAFSQSKMLNPIFMRHIAAQLCTCVAGKKLSIYVNSLKFF